MERFLDKIFVESLSSLIERVIRFLPNLITSIIILLLGFLIGWILKNLVTRFLRIINIDRLCDRYGVSQTLQKGGIKDTPSKFTGRFVYWVILLIFMVMSINALNIPAIEHLLSRFFLYLPSIFVAGAIIIFGYLLSNFLGRAALIASVNAGIKISGLIGRLVKLTVFLLSITMALEQLGIGRGTIISTFIIVFGGIVLALAIAFGLGGKDIAKEYLEKKIKGEEERDEIQHL
ncbi:MAG: hypothetical protein AB1488_07910 [Nitrospirota bacterium]